MASDFGEVNDRDTVLELFDEEGVAKVIDLGLLDSTDSEVAIDGGANVAD